MSGRRSAPTMPPEQLSIVWQSVSLLLNYPDEELVARSVMLKAVSNDMPASIGESIRTFINYLEATPLPSSRPTTSRRSTIADAAICS